MVLLGVGATLGAFALIVAVLGFNDLRRIRSELTTAQATLQQSVNDPGALRTPEGRAATIAAVAAAQSSIQIAAGRATGSLALRGAGLLPGLRAQRNGLLQLIADAGSAADAGGSLLSTVNSLAERNQLRDGVVPLDAARELGGDLRSTGAVFAGLVRSESGLWGPLADGRRRLDKVARDGSSRLGDGADAVGAALTFAGSGGDRRYLVAVLNNAEMRDQGAVLQYVVAKFTGSRLSFDGGGSVGELNLDRPAPTPLPPGTQAIFGPIRPTQTWQSVNASADFPLSGQAMADMYLQATGQSVDGVIAIDVPGLAAVLRVVGPVTLAGVPAPVDAQNVGTVLLHDLYQGVPYAGDQSGRRERLGDVTRAVIDRLTTGSRDAVALGRELGDAARGLHLRLWSRSKDEEAVFERTGLGGGPAATAADRTFHLAVENRTATKLDYYVKPSVRQDIELTKQGSLVVRTTVAIDNQAPTGQTTPSYQLGPDQFTKKPGDYLAWALLWGPAGSKQLQGGTVESGLNLSQYVTAVDAGQHQEVVFQTIVPNA
ncbi:MAG: DUF4012 domain-containing protein, partial [Actinomycetota bacterium]|nr:DUF4012 domain-containing protein [Actinomycetota bacterium]